MESEITLIVIPEGLTPDIAVEYLAMDYESIADHSGPLRDQILQYLYSPENEISDKACIEYDIEEWEIKTMKLITSEIYHPVSEVLENLQKLRSVADEMEDNDFYGCKDNCDRDLDDICEALTTILNSDPNAKVMLKRY